MFEHKLSLYFFLIKNLRNYSRLRDHYIGLNVTLYRLNINYNYPYIILKLSLIHI